MSKTSGPSVQHQLASVAARKETAQTHPGQKETLVPASKLAKNKRLPATMITPTGRIETSKKAKSKAESSKKRRRTEMGKEKALERMERLENKVRQSEERKNKRKRAKQAWE